MRFTINIYFGKSNLYEEVYFQNAKKPYYGIVIYYVEKGRIRKVFFRSQKALWQLIGELLRLGLITERLPNGSEYPAALRQAQDDRQGSGVAAYLPTGRQAAGNEDFCQH